MNEIIVDKTHKENITYISNAKFRASSDSKEITLYDMYNFVRDDISLAKYSTIVEEDTVTEHDFLRKVMGLTEEEIDNDFSQDLEKEPEIDDEFSQDSEEKPEPMIEIELGFLGQDLQNSNNPVKELVVDTEKAKKYNIALSCNQNNYINVLSGALKVAIEKIEEQNNRICELEQKLEDFTLNK